MYDMLKKIISVLLVITLAGANLSILGMYGITYAISNEVLEANNVEEQTGNEESDGTIAIEGILGVELTKYIPYLAEGKYGVMLQTKVSSGLKENVLPIKKTEISINVPTINAVKPTDVNVIALNTKATNGEMDGTKFNANNYEYISETGIVNITVENSNKEIVLKENVKDEYLVTYIFEGEDIYNYANTNGVDTRVTTSAKLELYDSEENNNLSTNVFEKIETPIKVTENLGNMVDFEISTVENQIGKGQVYLNYNESSTKKETAYFTRYISTINSIEITGELEFTQSIDKFLTEEGGEALTTISGKNYVYNKVVKVREDIFNKMLGESGTITLYNASDKENTNKTPLGIINKNTEIEEGYYTLDISEKDNNQLYIVTSEPVKEGQLVIDLEKGIKKDIDYSKTQFKNFSKIEIKVEGKTTTSTLNTAAQIILREPTSVGRISIDKTDLTTVVKNEDVRIVAMLDTSRLYNALYTNPTLKIILPSCISEVVLNKTDIIMANGLKIKETPNITTENDSKVINIELEGTQEEYTLTSDGTYTGTVVYLSADFVINPLTPTSSDEIRMKFTNENTLSTNEKGEAEFEVNFIAPQGVVTSNGIDDNLSISDEGFIEEIPIGAPSKVSTIYGKITNNYSNEINNVVILGRFPVKDNKKIDSEERLGSTFNTKLKTNIKVTGIEEGKYTVYYSENVKATSNLSETTNGWSTTRTVNAKSYMILTSDFEIASGGTIEFSYDVEIPEKLEYKNSVYQMYKVYYNNISEIGSIPETKTSAIVGLTTGQGAELKAELKSTVETVREGQIVKMKVDIINTGSLKAENVKVIVPLPKKARFVEYVTGNAFYEEDLTEKIIEVGTVEGGETKQVSYYIKFDDDMKESIIPQNTEKVTPEELEIIENGAIFPKEIISKVLVTTSNIQKDIESNEYKFNVEEGKISLNMVSETMESIVLKNGDSLTYEINIKNISKSGSLNNTVVTIPLPESIKYKSAVIKENDADENGLTEGIIHNEETNTLQINIGVLDTTKTIVLNLEIEEYEGVISIIAKAQAEGTEEHYSNITEYMSEIIKIEVSELTVTPKYVKEGQEVTYSLTVTNTGNKTVHNVNLTDALPEELVFVKATYMYAGKEEIVTTLKDEKVEVIIGQLEAGKSITVKVIAKAGLLSDKNEKEVQNQITITANNYDEIKTNKVTNIIEYNEKLREESGGSTPTNPSKPTEKTYKITGTSWIDENKNGKRDTDEELLENISVMLLNKEDNKVVTDPETKNQMVTTTDNQGKYEFTNVVKGEYIVIFLYDASKYSLTTYKQKDVDESLNSDVISININLDGERRIAGTTDEIKITDGNARDIDIGLYVSEKFDLRIDKYVSKITLTTPTSGTKVYSEGNSKLEKVEVLEKNLGKSNAVIEYKIVVTNEGAVPGYVKKIVDYLPEGVGFNTELNKDWYLSENGNVYNASLANEKINPGESKQVTLVVTKKITEDSLKSPMNNKAEIYESYNEQGLKDIDSEEGNKVQDEDDISEANIILSIVTGKIIVYTMILIGVAVILGTGVVVIKRKVVNK